MQLLTGSQHSRVDDVDPVGGGHDVDALPAFNAVHLRQKLVDYSACTARIAGTWVDIKKLTTKDALKDKQ